MRSFIARAQALLASRRARVVARAAVAIGLVVGLLTFVRRLDIAALGPAIARSRFALVALASALSVVHIALKAGYWRIMLAPWTRVGVPRLVRYAIAAALFSLIVPARAGDWLRLWMLRRDHGVALRVTGGITLGEKLLDVMGICAVLTPLVWANGQGPVPAWAGRALGWVALAGLAAGAAGVVLARVGRHLGPLAPVMDGFRTLVRPRVFVMAFGFVLATWVVDALMVDLVLRAVGAPSGVLPSLLVLFTVNLAIAVPVAPAQLGTMEAGAIVGLDLMHVPREISAAFALLYHGMQILPLLLLGIPELRLVLAARRAAQNEPS